MEFLRRQGSFPDGAVSGSSCARQLPLRNPSRSRVLAASGYKWPGVPVEPGEIVSRLISAYKLRFCAGAAVN